ncbi:unnamed protein product [Closterium sp. NIES-53]
MAAQGLRWLTYLLTDLGEQPRSPPVLYVDNKAMLALCREHRLEHRTKHIALRYFLARELQQRGQLRLAYVPFEANTADIFTKALAPGDHQRFCTLLACFALLDWSCDPLFSPTLPMGSFLGFVNYVRRFIPNMAGITGPLTDLLHKDKNFVWGEEAEAAFQELKKFLVSPPVLRIADPSKPFEVVTDASDFAIGAVLLQDFGNGLQPIAYESRKLQAAEHNYPIHDKEMLAIIHAFKLWRCYLVGADVTVRTDHKSLQYLRAQPNLNPRQIWWLDYMECHFTYRITYKKGANNIADALTRPTVQSAAVLIHHSNPLLTGLFTHGYTTDPFFTTGNHQQATTQQGDYYLKAGTDRIWVPAYRLLRELLIQEVHDSNFS